MQYGGARISGNGAGQGQRWTGYRGSPRGWRAIEFEVIFLHS